jgi:hypothetical protein
VAGVAQALFVALHRIGGESDDRDVARGRIGFQAAG